MDKRIVLGSDFAGFDLKEKINQLLGAIDERKKIEEQKAAEIEKERLRVANQKVLAEAKKELQSLFKKRKIFISIGLGLLIPSILLILVLIVSYFAGGRSDLVGYFIVMFLPFLIIGLLAGIVLTTIGAIAFKNKIDRAKINIQKLSRQ